MGKKRTGRKKVHARKTKKRDPVKRTNQVKYYRKPYRDTQGKNLTPQEELEYFSKNYLERAYHKYVDLLNMYDGDVEKQKQVIADYGRVLDALSGSGKDQARNAMLNKFLTPFGDINWGAFKQFVINNKDEFRAEKLARNVRKLGDIPSSSKQIVGLRRTVLRMAKIGVKNKSISTTEKGDESKIGVTQGQGTSIYEKLAGKINLPVKETDDTATQTFFQKNLAKFLKRKSNLSENQIETIQKCYPDPNMSLEEKIKDAKKDPQLFKKKLEELQGTTTLQKRSMENIYHKITGFDYKPSPGRGPVSTDSGKIDWELVKALNQAVGLQKNAKNPLTVAAAMKFGQMKREGLTHQQIVDKVAGKEIEASFILRAAEKLGRKTVREKSLKKRANKMGWQISGFEGLAEKNKEKKKSKTQGYTSSTTGSKGKATKKPEGLFGGKSLNITPTGDFQWRKKDGALYKTINKAGNKVRDVVKPKPNKRASDFSSKYRDLLPSDYFNEAKEKMRKTNWVKRRLLEHEANRMAYDKKYALDKMAKKKLDEGVAKAKYVKAVKQAEAAQKAAASPWYAAWHRFSLITKWLIFIGVAAAVLFLPVGMFYVLGWALAVGVVALIQFIVWVFMEIWLLLAQSVVTIVGLVGQTFTMVINWIGRQFAGFTDGEWSDSTFLKVQDMLMFERADDGSFVVSTYSAAGSEKQEILTWGQLNLVPPSFLKLDLYKPTDFNSNALIAYLFPPLKNFFNWLYNPIAARYTDWMGDLPADQWYWPGIIVGIPTLLIIIGVVMLYGYLKKKSKQFV